MVAPAEPIRFAVAGSSGFAANMAAPAVVGAPETELTGVLGSTASRGAALAHKLSGASRGYESLDEMLADQTVDAVWVAAHDALHEPLGVAAMDAGKHVIVEKPMATSVAQARRLIEAAERNGVVLRVGTHQRYRRVYGDLKRIIEEGGLGKLGIVRLQFNVPFPADRLAGNWRATLSESGGMWAVKEFGAHLLDLLLWWTGGPAEVVGAALATVSLPVETDDTAAMLLRLTGGGIGIIDTSAAMHGYAHAVEIYGTEGWIRARDVWRGGGHVERSSAAQPPFGSAALRVEYPGDEPLDPYLAQLADFASAIAGGPSIGATGEDGLAVLELLEAAGGALMLRQTF